MGKQARRLYTRNQGGVARFYADLRDYGDVGGRREALTPKGAKTATTDEALAQALLADRIADLEDRRRRRQRGEPEEQAFLLEYASYHLKAKAESGRVTLQWLRAAEKHLELAVQFFCHNGQPLPRVRGEVDPAQIEDVALDAITVREAQEYVGWLRKQPNGRGGTFSESSQRKYLNSLSNLYLRAIGERRVPHGFNPVAALMDKPQDAKGRREARWLEIHEAALLLHACTYWRPTRPDVAISPSLLKAIVATMLLTGGRPSEILGLEVDDVSFSRDLVIFRPNNSRSTLKTIQSERTVRLWPQLRDILAMYLPPHSNGTKLLFPSVRTGGRIQDLRKALDSVASLVGWAPGEIRPYAFRHTYTAARLQTLDNGAPIAPWSVARELGHGGRSLVDKVYGHLGEVRHRSEVVEYRVDQHRGRLREGLDRLDLLNTPEIAR